MPEQMNTFNPVTKLGYWCQKVLPLVYDDSLSYYELLCKVTAKLNELIENNNQLPDYIRQLIIEYLNGDVIKNILSQVIANFILNVKYPPAPIPPAVGDGNTDDTATFRQCLTYAVAHNMALYIPSGNYLVQSLTMPSGIALFGSSRHNSKITLKGGSSTPLLSGTPSNITITNLAFNGNGDVQTSNLPLISLIGSNWVLDNLTLADGSILLDLTTTTGNVSLTNIQMLRANATHMSITGTAQVSADNISCESLSGLYADTSIIINVNDSSFTNLFLNATVPTGIRVSGSRNNIQGVISNAVTPYVITGQNNTFLQNGDTFQSSLSHDANVSAANLILNMSSGITLNSSTLTLNPTNPIVYSKPLPLSPSFNYVPFTSKSGDPYNVLVAKDYPPDIWYDIRNFGAKGDGTTDDTAAFVSAVNSVPNGAIIFVPIGKYPISTVPITSKRLTFLGENGRTNAGSCFYATANQPMFNITNEGVSFYNLAFDTNTTLTSGCFIKETNTYRTSFVDCFFTHHFSCLEIDAGSSEATIDRCQFLIGSTRNLSRFITLGATGYTAPVSITNCLFRNLTGADTTYGIMLKYTDGVRITNCTLNNCGNGIIFEPEANQICSYTWIDNCELDTHLYNGILFQPAGGVVERVSITNCWIGECGRSSIVINAAGNTVSIINISSCILIKSPFALNVGGVGAANLEFSNSFIFGSTGTAIQVIDTVNGFKVHDNFIGGSASFVNNCNFTSGNESLVDVYNNNFYPSTVSNSFGFNTLVGENKGLEWLAYTPEAFSATGTLGAYTASGWFIRQGNMMMFNINAIFTDIGTGAGAINISLPRPIKRTITAAVKVGINAGQAICAAGAANLSIYKYDGTFPVANGEQMLISGCCEI